ncbi:MAG: GFA family protein [Salipiger marinus]|uniref:GFA family protein n=1 Tax=Salipiger marinus TaxID=555512 RepID=UPI004058C359
MDVSSKGGCRCGRLRFVITTQPLFTSACHCRGCQRMTGGPFSLSIGIPTPGFRVVEGEEVLGGTDHNFGHRFCGYCLSWVFTRPPGIDAFVNVRTTMLDDVPPEPPFIETCTAERLPWVQTGARYSFPAFPEMEEWGELVEAFAVSRA